MNAKQAQAVVKHSLPDLILMDIGLPDMDGLAHAIRNCVVKYGTNQPDKEITKPFYRIP